MLLVGLVLLTMTPHHHHQHHHHHRHHRQGLSVSAKIPIIACYDTLLCRASLECSA